MTSPNTPDPVTLAKIAAQLNPQLACDNPAKAIELAHNLLIAAAELAKQEDDRAEEMELQRETQRHEELFPRAELISLAEAFEALPGDYKTETRFAAALRKEKLTTVMGTVVKSLRFERLTSYSGDDARQGKRASGAGKPRQRKKVRKM
jgi:hypothetical protein